jgi:hypothetical protein
MTTKMCAAVCTAFGGPKVVSVDEVLMPAPRDDCG